MPLKLSIVTPSFNQGQFLEQTLKSVLDQGYPDLEYIVIDGGSTDNSVDIIKKYADRLTYWVSEPDKGHYDAVNKGFKHATGDIFFFLNSDDMLVPRSLSVVNEVFEQNADVSWIAGVPILWDIQGRVVCVAEKIPVYNRQYMQHGEHDARILPNIQQESCFWRRELWEKVGGINTRWDLAGDFDLWTRMAQHAEPVTVCTVLSGNRRHSEQRSGRQFDEYFAQTDAICAARGCRTFLRSSLMKRLRKLRGGSLLYRMLFRRKGTILVWEGGKEPRWEKFHRRVM